MSVFSRLNGRSLHYGLGLIVLIPIVVWIVTGVGFALLPRAEMDGRLESRGFTSPPVSLDSARLDPSRISAILRSDSFSIGEIRDIQFFQHPLIGRAIYLVRFVRQDTPALIDAALARRIPMFSETEAVEIARRDYSGEGDVSGVDWVTGWGEMRAESRDVPVYRVRFSNSKRTRIYISPYTGKIMSRRNVYMNVFSWLWHLHIFGWIDPDLQFNPGVLLFGALSLVSVIAGMSLWRHYFSKSAPATTVWRKTHFIFGVVVVVQVLIWIIGGIGFTLITHRNIGGLAESRILKADPPPDKIIDRAPTPLPPVEIASIRVIPWQVPDVLRRTQASPDPAQIEEATLCGHGLDAKPVYLVRIRGESEPYVFSAQTGEHLPRVTEAGARGIARRDYDGPGEIRDVEWITGLYQKGYDYFGELPVYRVNFTNWKRTRIYISPVTGQILLRRNIHKSLFNTLYQLHVFSYVNWSRTQNPGIIISGILTFLAVVAGTLLYFPYFRKKKTGGDAPAVEPSSVAIRQRTNVRG